MAPDEADGHEVVSLLANDLIGASDEEEQRDLLRVVRHEVESQFEVIGEERRRIERHVRRVAHQSSAKVRLRYLRICNRFNSLFIPFYKSTFS